MGLRAVRPTHVDIVGRIARKSAHRRLALTAVLIVVLVLTAARSAPSSATPNTEAWSVPKVPFGGPRMLRLSILIVERPEPWPRSIDSCGSGVRAAVAPLPNPVTGPLDVDRIDLCPTGESFGFSSTPLGVPRKLATNRDTYNSRSTRATRLEFDATNTPVPGAGSFKAGELFETSFKAPAGNVQVLAEVEVNGSQLVLKDVAIYGENGSLVNQSERRTSSPSRTRSPRRLPLKDSLRFGSPEPVSPVRRPLRLVRPST